MALRLLEPPTKDLPLLRKPAAAPVTALKPADDFLSMQTKAGKLPSYLSEKPQMIGKIIGSIMQTNPIESMARESSKLDYIQKYKQKFGVEPSPQEVSSFEGFYREGKAKEPIFKQAELPLTLAAANFAAAKPLMNIPKLAAFSGIQAVNPVGKIKTENQTAEFARDALNMLTSGGLTEGAFKLPAKVKTARSEGTLTDIAKNISAIEKGLSETVKNSPVFKNFWNTLSPRGKAIQVVRAAETNPAVGDVVQNILSRESAGRKSELLLGKKGEAKLPLPEEKPKIPFVPPVPATPVSPLIEEAKKYKSAEEFKTVFIQQLDFAQNDVNQAIKKYGFGGITKSEQHPELVKSDEARFKIFNDMYNALNPNNPIGSKVIVGEKEYILRQAHFDTSQSADTAKKGISTGRSYKLTIDAIDNKGNPSPLTLEEIGLKPISESLTALWQQAQGQPATLEPPKITAEQPWPEELPAKSPEIQPIEDRAEMEIEMMHYSNGLHPLEKAMRDIGKIRVQAKGKEAEESRETPSRFLSQKTGRPIDERRQELENKYGIAFESDSDLRQALKELGGKQQRFLLSSDVQAYLKSKPNIEALGRKLGKKISPAAYKKIIYSNVGLKPSKTPLVSTEEKMFKYVLKQREIAARGGFKAGKRELKTEIRGKKAERARMLEAAQRFPREQRYEIYKAARKAGLILPETKDPTGKVVQNYKNRLTPLLRFYKKASFDEIMNYIRALRGNPENPPLVFKISGDPTADAETMKMIAEASEGWQDINRLEIGSLDLPRIVEKVTGLEIFEDNILADNTYEVLKGADDARFERMSEELEALENNAKEFAAETKASAELMRKFEVGENLSEKEKKAADFLRSKYDDLIKQANENRERLGKKPIPYRKDYMTHIRDWNLLTAFFKGDQKAIDNLTNEQWQALAKGQYSKISVPFNQFAQQRTGKKTKFDAIGNYKKYLETLLYEIYMSPAIKHARVFTDYALLKQPNAKIAIDNLLDELAGKPSSFDHIAIRPIVSNPVLKALNARFGANALIGNISYYIMNASNIATASGELGNYTIKGMHGFLSNSYLRQLAFKKSSLLKSRQGLFDFEISRLEAFFVGHGKDLTFWEGAKLKDKQLEYVISSINRIIEYNNVGSSWVGAYLKAIDKFKYSPEKAYKYADSVARKTQGGYRPYEMPAYMRSDIGKLASKFGTWAFNMMNYFLYDLKMANIPGNIARIITKAPKKQVQFGKFIVLVTTLMFVNAVYKKMGLRKPYNPKSFVPATPLTRGRYEQPPAGRMMEDVKTLLPLEGKRKEKPSTRAKAAEELFFMLGPRYGGAQLRRLFHGDILPEQKKERKNLRLLSNN